jgi:hypothetical protein
LLVLISRILVIAALVFAFAQPYIPDQQQAGFEQGGSVVSIYIDNSFSMEAEAVNGELLELARAKAGEITRAYRSSDRFQLLTNDFEGRHQRIVSQDEVLEMIDEVSLSPNVQLLSGILQRQAEVLANARTGKRIRFILSDFQKSIIDFSRIADDSTIFTYLVPLVPESTGNLYIDSCWFESPVHQLGQTVKLLVRVKNDSDEDYQKIPLKLTVNSTQKALSSFSIQAGSEIIVELPYTNHETGIQYGTLQISDYPVTFDDDLFLVYVVQPSIPVLTVFGEQPPVFLNTLLAGDSTISHTAVYYKNINYSEISSYLLVILSGLPEVSSGLSQELSEFCRNGGSLMIIPGEEIDLQSYRQFLGSLGVSSFGDKVKAETKVSYLDMEHPVFLDVFEDDRLGGKNPEALVDLPAVNEYYPIRKSNNTFKISLMRMLNQADFLSVEPSGKGTVYLLAVPLDDKYTNFQRHALFVPVIYRIAFLSGETQPLYYSVGSSQAVTLDNTDVQGDDVLKIVGLGNDIELIPRQRNAGSSVNLMVNDQLNTSGHYRVVSRDGTIAGLAFNYDRRESALSFQSPSEITKLLNQEGLNRFLLLDDNVKPLQESILDINQGKRLWKLFIIFALIFLAIEVFLLRVWSKN